MKTSKILGIGIASLIGVSSCVTKIDEDHINTENSFFMDIRTGQKVNIHNSELMQYNSLAERVIMESKKAGTYAIVVNKLNRRLDLYFKGDLARTFPVSLSRNPLEAKLYELDYRVPEGIYNISKVRDVGETIFYKAFMLNYPNERDRRNFLEARRDGLIPDHVNSPGGSIEIHGDGKDFDWTTGCVALRNEDMDELFPLIKVGTPVALVNTYEKPIRR